MTRLFLSIYDYLSRHKWLATLLLVAGIGLCIWLGAQLNYKENITDFLPQNKENEKFTSVYEGLGDQGKITLVFRTADSTLTPEEGQERLMEAVVTSHPLYVGPKPQTVFVRQFDASGIALRAVMATRTVDENFIACSEVRQQLEETFNGIRVILMRTRGLDSFYAERRGLIVGF